MIIRGFTESRMPSESFCSVCSGISPGMARLTVFKLETGNSFFQNSCPLLRHPATASPPRRATVGLSSAVKDPQMAVKTTENAQKEFRSVKLDLRLADGALLPAVGMSKSTTKRILLENDIVLPSLRQISNATPVVRSMPAMIFCEQKTYYTPILFLTQDANPIYWEGRRPRCPLRSLGAPPLTFRIREGQNASRMPRDGYCGLNRIFREGLIARSKSCECKRLARNFLLACPYGQLPSHIRQHIL